MISKPKKLFRYQNSSVEHLFRNFVKGLVQMANTLYLWNTYLNKVRYIVGNAIQNILSTYNRPNKMLRSTFHDKKKFEGIWKKNNSNSWIVQQKGFKIRFALKANIVQPSSWVGNHILNLKLVRYLPLKKYVISLRHQHKLAW